MGPIVSDVVNEECDDVQLLGCGCCCFFLLIFFRIIVSGHGMAPDLVDSLRLLLKVLVVAEVLGLYFHGVLARSGLRD